MSYETDQVSLHILNNEHIYNYFRGIIDKLIYTYTEYNDNDDTESVNWDKVKEDLSEKIQEFIDDHKPKCNDYFYDHIIDQFLNDIDYEEVAGDLLSEDTDSL